MRYITALFVLSTLFACNNNDANTNEHAKAESTKVVIDEPVTKTSCYWYANKKDTVMLTMKIKGPLITGDLKFNFFEKDLNNGTIVGQMKDDTIIVDYYFRSEGAMSKRQEVFLKSGTALVRGNGEAVEKNGEWVYKNIANLNFSKDIVLQKMDCKQ